MNKIFLFIVVFCLQNQLYAAYTLTSPVVNIPDATQLPYTSTPAISIFSAIIAYAIGIAGILAVIGVTIGGVQMVLAAGDDEKLKKGRYTLIYSLIGVLIAGMAYGLVDVISKFRL